MQFLRPTHYYIDELMISTITSPGELTIETACTCLESLKEAIDKVGELPQGLHDSNIDARPWPISYAQIFPNKALCWHCLKSAIMLIVHNDILRYSCH